jgi:hypothetical protein
MCALGTAPTLQLIPAMPGGPSYEKRNGPETIEVRPVLERSAACDVYSPRLDI